MNLFIDTNIYLTFYHFTSEALEELRKLQVAIRKKKIVLFITNQISAEFSRNRESKISDALKLFQEQKITYQVPIICKDYLEHKDMQDSVRLYEESKKRMLTNLTKDIESKNLPADKLIKDLFGVAVSLPNDATFFDSAKKRIALGNPPGKNKSLGDAINWETLLGAAPDGEDIYIISDDSDYASPLNSEKISQYLEEEWHAQKKSNVYLYTKLSIFFAEKFPSIKLASELEKQIAIEELIQSGSFDATHNAIARLSAYPDFADSQIRELIEAAIYNNQISWISKDDDVSTFFFKLIKGKEHLIDPSKLSLFKSAFQGVTIV